MFNPVSQIPRIPPRSECNKMHPSQLLHHIVQYESAFKELEVYPLSFSNAEHLFYWFCTTHNFKKLLKGHSEKNSGISTGNISHHAELALYRQICFSYTQQTQGDNLVCSPHSTYLLYTHLFSDDYSSGQFPSGLIIQAGNENQISKCLKYNISTRPSRNHVDIQESILENAKRKSEVFAFNASSIQVLVRDADSNLVSNSTNTTAMNVPFTKPEFYRFASFIIQHSLAGSTHEEIVKDYERKLRI